MKISISSSILRSIILIILSISTDIYFRNIRRKKLILKLIHEFIKTFLKVLNTRPKYFDTTVRNVHLMLSVDLDCTNVNSSSTSNNTEGEIPI